MSTAISTRPSSGNLYDVIDVILDKGLVIDAFVRVSLVGIELLTIDARVVVASVDTYLHFAEAANRLDLSSGRQPAGLSTLAGVTGLPGGLGIPNVEDAIEGGAARLQDATAE
jgi:hypothetical protein